MAVVVEDVVVVGVEEEVGVAIDDAGEGVVGSVDAELFDVGVGKTSI